MLITKEITSNGAVITEPKSIECSAKLVIYKLNFDYPPRPGSLKLGPALGEVLSTHRGIYTSMGSALVTEKVRARNRRNRCSPEPTS